MQPGLFAVNLRGTPDQISPRQQLLGSIISKMLCKVILDIFRVGGKRGYLKKKKVIPTKGSLIIPVLTPGNLEKNFKNGKSE